MVLVAFVFGLRLTDVEELAQQFFATFCEEGTGGETTARRLCSLYLDGTGYRMQASVPKGAHAKCEECCAFVTFPTTRRPPPMSVSDQSGVRSSAALHATRSWSRR